MNTKSWGVGVIPKSSWIDPAKNYTCGGHKVRGLSIELHNSTGAEVTYPVRGIVQLRDRPRKWQSRIWSLDGRADVVWGKGDNLISEVVG